MSENTMMTWGCRTREKKLLRICPLCGRTYTGVPALSRTDSSTEVCPDCSIRQALSAAGVKKEAQERILHAIHEANVRPK